MLGVPNQLIATIGRKLAIKHECWPEFCFKNDQISSITEQKRMAVMLVYASDHKESLVKHLKEGCKLSITNRLRRTKKVFA